GFFVDRGYTPPGTLVPRRGPGAPLHDPEEGTARVLRVGTEGKVTAVDRPGAGVRGGSGGVRGGPPGAGARGVGGRAGRGGRRARCCCRSSRAPTSPRSGARCSTSTSGRGPLRRRGSGW